MGKNKEKYEPKAKKKDAVKNKRKISKAAKIERANLRKLEKEKKKLSKKIAQKTLDLAFISDGFASEDEKKKFIENFDQFYDGLKEQYDGFKIRISLLSFIEEGQVNLQIHDFTDTISSIREFLQNLGVMQNKASEQDLSKALSSTKQLNWFSEKKFLFLFHSDQEFTTS